MEVKVELLAWFVLATLLRTRTYAFNVDVDRSVVHLGPGTADSMFGFSVALHREHQEGCTLVGSPMDNPRPEDAIRAGGVYRCQPNAPGRCESVIFASRGNLLNETDARLEYNVDPWFGATLASGGIDGPVVACAPRYTLNESDSIPIGKCMVARSNFQEIKEFLPCLSGDKVEKISYLNTGYCQAGFSAAIAELGSDYSLLIGAPGSWQWNGQTYTIKLSNGDTASTPKPTANLVNYMGYSIAYIRIGRHRTAAVAAGMPRVNSLLGKVLISDLNNPNRAIEAKLSGTQLGEYYGYAISVGDWNGDGMDDLIVGAPMYTATSSQTHYETGRVFVYFQKKTPKVGSSHFGGVKLEGASRGGRFGMALASLGDLNQDGFGDFAVSAPYTDGGEVFIYLGQRASVTPKCSQILTAKDVAVARPVSTFGFSLSGALDVDDNLYPDLAVGAYASNMAVTYRTRAVVQVNTDLSFGKAAIVLTNPECDGFVCSRLQICWNFTGRGLPERMLMVATVRLDTHRASNVPARILFGKLASSSDSYSGEFNITADRNCMQRWVYMRMGIADTKTALVANITVTNVTTETVGVPPYWVKGVSSPAKMTIELDCGKSLRCRPELQLQISDHQVYLLGSNEPLIVNASVANSGDNAYGAYFSVQLPQSLTYRQLVQIAADGHHTNKMLTCTAPDSANQHTLRCDIGNPMGTNASINFRLELLPDVQSVHSEQPGHLQAEVGSANSDPIRAEHRIDWLRQTDVTISGRFVESQPMRFRTADYVANAAEASREEQLGPQLVSMFQVRNLAALDVDGVEVLVVWPHETATGDRLWYLLNEPQTLGNINCSQPDALNPLGVTLNATLADFKQVEMIDEETPTSGANADEMPEADIGFGDRKRRSLPAVADDAGSLGEVMARCNRTHRCSAVRCVTGRLQPDESAWIALRTRLVASTVDRLADYSNGTANLSATAVVQVAAGRQGVQRLWRQFTLEATAGPEVIQPISMRIVLYAAAAMILGLIVLMLVTYGMYRCNFFKRTRPPKGEQQFADQLDGSKDDLCGSIEFMNNPNTDDNELFDDNDYFNRTDELHNG